MIEMIMELSKNPVFGGIIGGSIFAGLMVYLKSVPFYILKFIKRRLTYQISVDNSHEAFVAVEKWLSNLKYSNKRCKSFQLKSIIYENKKNKIKTNIGFGNHFFIYNKKLFFISKTLDTKEKHTWQDRPETISLTFTCLTKNGFDNILKEIEDSYIKNKDTINIYIPHPTNKWIFNKEKKKRSLDTVFIPDNQKQRILDDIKKFEKSEQEYLKKSIPYRRGYLLEGPPGTGKTTLAFSLAAYSDKNIYFLNLNSISNDNKLIELFNSLPKDIFLIIEDVDCAITEERLKKQKKENDEENNKISLSCLLNCLDGIIAKENVITIMTTNHPKKIDPALLRPGRIDVRETIDYIQPLESIKMCNHLLEDKTQIESFLQEIDFENLTAAELQNKILIKNAA